MAYTTGTANNYRDLLDRLRTFFTSNAALVAAGQQWTELRWTSDASSKELILRAPGLAGTEQIFVGIRTYEDATSGYYAWDLNGFIGFNAANTFYNQPGAIAGGGPPSGYLPMLALWNASIPYWLVANGRRLVLVAKVSTVYQAAYLGFILPYATPVTGFHLPLALRCSLERQGAVLEQLPLPPVKHGRVQTMLVAQIRNRRLFQQMHPDDGHLLLGRIVFAALLLHCGSLLV